MVADFEGLYEGVLLVLLDPRYTQVGFNLVSVQVCEATELETKVRTSCATDHVLKYEEQAA